MFKSKDNLMSELAASHSLAAVMQEAGHTCTSDDASFSAIAKMCPRPTEATVAEVLAMMARNSTGTPDQFGMHAALAPGADPPASPAKSWNARVVINVIKAIAPDLSWPKVVENLDHDKFVVADPHGLALITTAYHHATRDRFPLTAVLNRVWRHPAGQISFLRFATLADPDVFTFEHSPRKATPLDGLPAGKHPAGAPNHAWLSIDLAETLGTLAQLPGQLPPVRQILEPPLKTCPEVLLTTFAAAPDYSPLQHEVLAHLLPAFLSPTPTSLPVLHRLWTTPPARPHLTRALLDHYTLDPPAHLPRILDIVHDLRALPPILDSLPYPLALDVAAAAASRYLLPLDKFLADRLASEGPPFLTHCLKFLDLKLATPEPPPSAPAAKSALSPEATAAFLRALSFNAAAVDATELQRVRDAAAKRHPQLPGLLAQGGPPPASFRPGAAATAPGVLAIATPPVTFSHDVEAEVNDVLQRMYNDTRPAAEAVGEVLAMLLRHQGSGKPHEQQVLACMIHDVLDETKFYSTYPDKQLRITALLLGGLIHHSLLPPPTLVLALRYLANCLDASPPASKLFKFATEAIRPFHADLPRWSNFCKSVLASKHARDIPPDTYALLQKAASDDPSAPPPGAGAPQDPPPPPTSTSTGLPMGYSPSAGGSAVSHIPAAVVEAFNSAPRAAPPPAAAPPNGSSGGSIGPPPAAGPGSRTNPPTSDTPTNPNSSSNTPNTTPPSSTNSAPTAAGPPAAAAAPSSGPPPGPPNIAPQTGSFHSSMNEILNRSGTNIAAQVASSTLTPGLVNTTNAESLGETAAIYSRDFAEPTEKTRDRIAFLMNNLSSANLEKHVKEIRALLVPKYTDWFANYLTVKRAAQEPNFHPLYVQLVKDLDHKDLYRALIKATHHYVRYMLSGERIKSNSNDRQLLKYLASWLGLLTFGRDKAILAKDLDLKHLILDGYKTGKMFPVLIVVGKLLENCVTSKVFKPPNPYTMSILSLCAEVYRLDQLKLNLKFEIERMFRLFPDVSLETIRPSAYLANLPRDTSPSNPDFQAINPIQAAPPSLPEPAPGPAGGQPGALGPTQPAPPARPAPGSGAPVSGHIPPPPSTGPSPRNASHESSQASVAPQPPQEQPQAQQQQQAQQQAPQQQQQASPAAAPPAPPAPEASVLYAGLLANLAGSIQIGPQLLPFAERLQLRKNVQAAMERAVSEIIAPVVERSVMIACMTTYELILKDFALEPEETRMAKAAHLMASSLAGSLAIVTGKEPLRVSLSNHLRALLMALSPGDAGLVDQAVGMLVADNLDAGCLVIEAAASEKARGDIDKSLAPAYEARRKAKAMNQPFYPEAYQQRAGFPASLPESLKPQPGNQSRVYDDFTRIPRTAPPAAPAPGPAAPGQPGPAAGRPYPPGMAPAPQLEAEASKGPDPLLTNEQVLQKFVVWQQRIDAAVAKEANGILPEPANVEVQMQVQDLTDAVNATVNPEELALTFAKRIFSHLYDAPNKSHIAAFVRALDALLTHTPAKSIPAELTATFVKIEDGRKYHVAIGEALVRAGLLLLAEVDEPLSRTLLSPAAPQHAAAADFALHIIKTCVVEAAVVPPSDVWSTLDVLGRLAMRPGASEAVMHLVEKAYAAAGANAAAPGAPATAAAAAAAASGGKLPLAMTLASYMRVREDPPQMKEAVVQLFDDWARTVAQKVDDQRAMQAALANSLSGLQLLDLDDRSDRFVRMLVDFAVQHCLSSEQVPPGGRAGAGSLNFIAVDTLAKLLAALATPQPAHRSFGEPCLARILHVLVNAVKRDADAQLTAFNPRPYLRLFVGLLCELSPSDPADPQGFRNLKLLASALFSLQPSGYPGFAFAWLEIVSHRHFMPKLLLAPGQQGWKLFEALLIALLRFMEPFLRNADIPDTIRQLYKGTLRVLLVLLHDFPEFLCEHHFQLCDAIPFTCIQLRNLILSAFPHNMRLPDPFTPNLKVDLLPEIQTRPRIFPDPDTLLAEPLRSQLIAFLKTRQPASFPADLSKRLLLPPAEAAAAGTPYNVPLINALALNLGAQSKPGANPATNSPAMDIFHYLVASLDSEGRYLFLNALANQLRYPNAYTHYFSCVLLCLFAEAKSVAHKEQITRVLLERLVVNRPHPWGLLITFIELIKNPRYAFWGYPFTRCAPEIERLFESVARSCIGGAAPRHEDEPLLQAEPARA